MYFVYILQCDDGTLYTGITNDLKRRFKQHKTGKGALYTKWHGAKKFLFKEEREDRGAALKREAEIKRWPRTKKLALIGASRRK